MRVIGLKVNVGTEGTLLDCVRRMFVEGLRVPENNVEKLRIIEYSLFRIKTPFYEGRQKTGNYS